MTTVDDVRLAAAVRAYERGRLLIAVCAAGVAALLAVVAVALGTSPVVAAPIGALLAVVVAVFTRAGGPRGRAVRPGLVVGGGALVVALAAKGLHGCSDVVCGSTCVASCVVAGVGGGMALALWALADDRRAAVWVPAAVVAFGAGALGCAAGGAFGLVGLGLGLAVGTVPVVVVARAR